MSTSKTFTVTCHTAGCENDDIPILIVSEDAEPYVICGPCGQTISDIIVV